MTAAASLSRDALLAQMRQIVGASHVLTDEQSTRRFRKGHRTGEGNVLAVVRPGSLLEQIQREVDEAEAVLVPIPEPLETE